MKEKLNKEKGITLVALIITIIVLVILAAVTIKAAFQGGILDLAAKGAENYAIAQTEEEDMMNELENFIKDKLNEIDNVQGTQNSAPRWAEGGEPHSVEERKTDTQITIAMTAVDDDGDDLTYIIKYYMCNEDGTKGEYIGEKKIEAAPEGEEQTVDITELTINTRYYFEVSVSDNIESSTVYVKQISTFCNDGKILSTLYGIDLVDLYHSCGLKIECPYGGSFLSYMARPDPDGYSYSAYSCTCSRRTIVWSNEYKPYLPGLWAKTHGLLINGDWRTLLVLWQFHE